MSTSALKRWLGRAECLGRWFETSLLLFLFSLLLGLASLQIVLRNGFSAGVPWADELVRLLVLWLAVMGALAAARDSKHIAIGVLTRLLSVVWRRVAAIAVNAFAAIVSGAFAWQSWRFVGDSRDFGDVLLGGWPAWMLQIILPVGFALMAYRYVIGAARVAMRKA